MTRLLFPALNRLYATAEPIAYALLRVAFGLILMTHGLPKLMGTSHGSMADPMAGSMNLIQNVLHLPGAPVLAMFVALLETFGGAMLVIGLLIRLVAPMFVFQMLAIAIALGPTWAWIDRGIEYPVLMLFLALYLSFRGADRYSVDRMVDREL